MRASAAYLSPAVAATLSDALHAGSCSIDDVDSDEDTETETFDLIDGDENDDDGDDDLPLERPPTGTAPTPPPAGSSPLLRRKTIARRESRRRGDHACAVCTNMVPFSACVECRMCERHICAACVRRRLLPPLDAVEQVEMCVEVSNLYFSFFSSFAPLIVRT